MCTGLKVSEIPEMHVWWSRSGGRVTVCAVWAVRLAVDAEGYDEAVIGDSAEVSGPRLRNTGRGYGLTEWL